MFGRTRNLIQILIGELQSMTLNIADLQDELARNSDVQVSASLLMRHLIAELEANKNDPAALDALIQKLKDNDASLAQSVADTQAADQPADTPPAASGDDTVGAGVSDDSASSSKSTASKKAS